MKTFLLLALSVPSLLLAQGQPIAPPQNVVPPGSPRRVVLPQNPPTSSETLPDNYQVTLILKDKDGASTEIAVVTSAPRFVATVGEQNLNFQGALSLQDDGTVLVDYSLGWQTAMPVVPNNTQYANSSVQGVVRLRPGADPETIFRSGTRTAVLSLIKLPTPKAR